MKKLLIMLVLLMCAGMVHASAMSDVPTDHWAYDAVQSLVARGYMAGFPDGEFKGNKVITRYEFAKAIVAIADDMTAKIAAASKTSEPASTPAPEVTKTDIDRIERLINEFKNEVSAKLGTDDKGVSDLVNELSTKFDAMQDEIAKLKSTVEAHDAILTDPEGAFETAKSDISTLKKVKVSGFIQARWTGSQGGLHGGTAASPTDPKGSNQYSIRRSRVKVTADPTDKTELVLQTDLGGNSVTLKDAYIQHKLNDSLTLTLGQMNVPFGYQITESDTAREMPERCMMISAFFNGERDRGATLTGNVNGINWVFGSFNGSGANVNDTNRQTDVMGRLSRSLGNLELGASGYWGNGYNAGKNPGRKNRYGIDARYYMHGLTFKSEYLWAKNTESAQVRGFDETINGGYAQLAYNLRNDLVLVGNYDRMSKDVASVLDYGLREAYNVGLIKYLDDKTKIKFFYQFNKEEQNTVRNNNYIVELISAF